MEVILGWISGVSMKDRMTSEELRKLIGIKPINIRK